MLYIFHGDDHLTSRQALNKVIDSVTDSDTLRLDAKNTTVEIVNNFLNSPTFFSNNKVLVLANFFSLPKATLDKAADLIKSSPDITTVLWQDKKLTAAQLKLFPSAKSECFELGVNLFSSVNAIRPGNLTQFANLYQESLLTQPFELLLYQIRGSFRRQLSSYSKFPQKELSKAYLQIIEMEYLYKSGQLTIAKETALLRIISNLIAIR